MRIEYRMCGYVRENRKGNRRKMILREGKQKKGKSEWGGCECNLYRKLKEKCVWRMCEGDGEAANRRGRD